MKIEVGKKYETADGKVVGPMKGLGHLGLLTETPGDGRTWHPKTGKGRAWALGEDLVREHRETKFKVGDKIRRAFNGVFFAPIGFETVLCFGPKNCLDDTRHLYFIDNKGDRISFHEENWELIEESPIREVTTKQLNEGKYGVVNVDVHKELYIISVMPEDGYNMTADELRKAAKTFTEIAEFLEG